MKHEFIEWCPASDPPVTRYDPCTDDTGYDNVPPKILRRIKIRFGDVKPVPARQFPEQRCDEVLAERNACIEACAPMAAISPIGVACMNAIRKRGEI